MSAERTFTTTADQLAHYDGRAFELDPILHTAEHAVAVYSDAGAYSFAAVQSGFEGGTIIERGAAQVGLAWSKRVIVVTGRGSSQPADWRDDLLSIVRVGWEGVLPPGCRVGYGFKRQMLAGHRGDGGTNRLAPQIVARLRILMLRSPDAEVVITGHSLGAALVWLIVAYLHAQGIKVRFAAAHESPRVGNERFAAWYDETFTYGVTPTWSIVNVSGGQPDLVTRLPRKQWGFRHAGRRVILAAAAILFGDDAWQDHRADNPVTNRVAAWRIITRIYRSTAASVRAHYGRSLLAKLRELCEGIRHAN